MIARFIWQALARDPRAKLLALSSLALASGLIAALVSIALNIGDQMAREMASYGANLEILPRGADLSVGEGPNAWRPLQASAALDDKFLPRIMDIYWRNNVMGFTPWLEGEVRDLKGEALAIAGTAFAQTLPLEDDPEFQIGVQAVFPTWLHAGRWPVEGAKEVSLGRRLAHQRRLTVGDTLPLADPVDGTETVWRITAIHASGGPEDDRVLFPLAAAQHWLRRPGELHAVRVRALAVPEDDLSRAARRDPDQLDALEWDRWYCTAYVSSIAHQLDEVFPNGTTRPVWQIVATEGAVIRRLEGLLLVITLAAAIVAAVGVASFVSLTVVQRQTEVALMKALGATTVTVLALFLGETLLLALGGGLLGSLLGTLLAQVIGWSVFAAPVPFSPTACLLVLLASLLIAVGATLTSARRLARLDPAPLLHEAV